MKPSQTPLISWLQFVYTISMYQKSVLKKEIQELSVSQEISRLRRELFNIDL